ncbi:MAG: hypothetical protein PHD33_02230 [Atribacterota bacterium]|nr:hypothetical protein [Atribacterota bacterium]
MAYIKSALEIALEKSKKIDRLNPQEMAEIKQNKKIDSILAKYYKDQIDSDELWNNLKGISDKYLIKAQNNFLQSLTFQSNVYDIEKRKKGILAIENLKKTSKLTEIEDSFHKLSGINQELENKKEQLIKDVKEEFERNPEKRMQTFQQGNQIMLKEIGFEEYLSQDEDFKNNLNYLEKNYQKKFDNLKKEINRIVNS